MNKTWPIGGISHGELTRGLDYTWTIRMTARTLVEKKKNTLELRELARQLSGLKTFVTQAWRPEFHPQSPYKDGRREQIPVFL